MNTESNQQLTNEEVVVSVQPESNDVWTHEVMPVNYQPLSPDPEYAAAVARLLGRVFRTEIRKEEHKIHLKKRKIKKIAKASKKRNRRK